MCVCIYAYGLCECLQINVLRICARIVILEKNGRSGEIITLTGLILPRVTFKTVRIRESSRSDSFV